MTIIFQYEIRVNGLFMATSPTLKGAIAKVAEFFSHSKVVTVSRAGEIVWVSKKDC